MPKTHNKRTVQKLFDVNIHASSRLSPFTTFLSKMIRRRLSEPPLRRRFVSLLLIVSIVLPLLVTVTGEIETTITTDQQCAATSSSGRVSYHHLVVLVHGYLGSDREQEYLGEALMKESEKLIDDDSLHDYANGKNINNKNEGTNDSCHRGSHHQLAILNSKANVKGSTDGVAQGGKRLAEEISQWIAQQTATIERSESEDDSKSASTIVTFSMIGNSLGGLYGRYALAELDDIFHNNTDDKDDTKNPILPLVFCTTSSPHIGTSQNTFIKLPRWVEPYVATVLQQQTMDDLFGVNNSTVVMDMCLHPTETNNGEEIDNKDKNHEYLYPLQQFQKRIAVANAYKTDFLVSVSSGAFLSLDSNSIHHHQDSVTSSTRLMKDMGYVALQVVTKPKTTNRRDDGDEKSSTPRRSCVDSLDELGWHKIFIDTRNILPGFLNFLTPELKPHATYTSKVLKEHFETHGTLLPIAHPLNMANSRTDLYRKMTKSGQPIIDALAELLVLDMVELSERQEQERL